MDEKERDVLQKCHDYLIKNINPLPLIDNLYSAGVLTNDDSVRLRQGQVTPEDQSRSLLVDILPKAGPTAFSALTTALQKTDQSPVADHLLERWRKGRPIYVLTFTRCSLATSCEHNTIFTSIFVHACMHNVGYTD